MNEIDFIRDVNKEAAKYGYMLIKIRPKCKDCKYLNGEKNSLGIKCTNPDRIWRSSTATYRRPSEPSCKMFAPDPDVTGSMDE